MSTYLSFALIYVCNVLSLRLKIYVWRKRKSFGVDDFVLFALLFTCRVVLRLLARLLYFSSSYRHRITCSLPSTTTPHFHTWMRPGVFVRYVTKCLVSPRDRVVARDGACAPAPMLLRSKYLTERCIPLPRPSPVDTIGRAARSLWVHQINTPGAQTSGRV